MKLDDAELFDLVFSKEKNGLFLENVKVAQLDFDSKLWCYKIRLIDAKRWEFITIPQVYDVVPQYFCSDNIVSAELDDFSVSPLEVIRVFIEYKPYKIMKVKKNE